MCLYLSAYHRNMHAAWKNTSIFLEGKPSLKAASQVFQAFTYGLFLMKASPSNISFAWMIWIYHFSTAYRLRLHRLNIVRLYMSLPNNQFSYKL